MAGLRRRGFGGRLSRRGGIDLAFVDLDDADALERLGVPQLDVPRVRADGECGSASWSPPRQRGDGGVLTLELHERNDNYARRNPQMHVLNAKGGVSRWSGLQRGVVGHPPERHCEDAVLTPIHQV